MSRHLSLALLALGSLAAAAPVPKLKKLDPFPYAVGTRWEYVRSEDPNRVYAEEVTESGEKDGVRTVRIDITTDTGGKMFETYKLEKGELRLTASTNATYDPPLLIRTAEMKDGDTWTNEYTLNGTAYEVAYSVGKPEELDTPAGKFTAYPITRKYLKPNLRAKETTYWYGDGVGLVRQETDGLKIQELKTFTKK
jgi:hypothetical protein